ncbi:MAG: hypothetical protein AAF485_16870 [Chloroflexota bacterium]
MEIWSIVVIGYDFLIVGIVELVRSKIMKNQEVLIITPQDVESLFYGDVLEALALVFKERGFDFFIQSVSLASYEYKTIKSFCSQFTPDILMINDAYLTESIITFCNSFREDPETKQIGLFIVSTYHSINADKEWWDQWFDLVDDYITTPLEISEFEKRLNDIGAKISE